MNNFFKTAIAFFVAGVCAVLTYLFAKETGAASAASSVFSGVYCGLVAGCAFEFGKNEWSKESLYTICGGVVGGLIGGLSIAHFQ